MTDLDLDATLAAGEQMCQIFTVGPRGTSWRIDDVSVRAVQAALPALVVALREARTAIARVRALCASADDSEYTTTFAAAVVAALDVRHDPSATTDGGEAAEALLGIVLAVAFAALLLWRLTS